MQAQLDLPLIPMNEAERLVFAALRGRYGEANKITRAELQEKTRLSDRINRRAIMTLAQKRIVVIVSSPSGGYYLPANQADIDRYNSINDRRAETMYEHTAAVQRAKAEMARE